ncbi:F-box only protein 31-B [Madurella fahalii]|uniref:F-box only protein 31-B n=1 Tax=Madurella fahalii TaxID=1157608 RepID=A0ABQ0FXG4_9PEZI
MAGFEHLPGEILLHILSFLNPREITILQLVSRGFRNLARDDGFWRARCLQESSYLEALGRRRRLFRLTAGTTATGGYLGINYNSSSSSSSNSSINNGGIGAVLDLGSSGDDDDDGDGRKWPGTSPSTWTGTADFRERERVRIMANWDPCFPSERVSWYDEYIQRHGPVAVNWFQFAYDTTEERTLSSDVPVEARGVALYYPDSGGRAEGSLGETVMAVSPLDDGSVCLWDVGGTRGKRGAVVARSRPGILFIDGPGADNSMRSKRVDSGVTECVSVDSWKHRAFFAVQSHLIEVDLQTLSVVGCESYPWSITALSAASPAVPLTVGTSLGIHLHDYRSRKPSLNDAGETIDGFDLMGAKDFYERSLRHIFDDEPLPPYAPLSQPGPLSILHLQAPGQEAELSDDIYVAGRFSNILHYDRRKFPSIRGSIHSGARLCSMTSLPYPFSTLDSELRRKGELSLEQVEASKSAAGGRTLIACGEYNTKGSLEIYGLSPGELAHRGTPGGLQNSTFKNRQTSSQSKLLSVVNHGSRIAFSDGSGYIKWFERDGFTEVRRCKIGRSERPPPVSSIFASMPGFDDLARKLLPTRPGAQASDGRGNDNDLLFWTGDKLGLVTFSARPGFMAGDFEEQAPDAEALARESEARAYSERMRLALERQADDVRFVRNLGLGSGLRPASV